MPDQILIVPVTPEHRDAIISLLEAEGLPTRDLPAQLSNFLMAADSGSVIGAAGLEVYEHNGLLRSLVVKPEYRKKKIALALQDELERLGRNLGLTGIYLLTENAQGYFSKHGYEAVQREDAPKALKRSSEFSQLCPATAILMRKML